MNIDEIKHGCKKRILSGQKYKKKGRVASAFQNNLFLDSSYLTIILLVILLPAASTL